MLCSLYGYHCHNVVVSPLVGVSLGRYNIGTQCVYTVNRCQFGTLTQFFFLPM